MIKYYIYDHKITLYYDIYLMPYNINLKM